MELRGAEWRVTFWREGGGRNGVRGSNAESAVSFAHSVLPEPLTNAFAGIERDSERARRCVRTSHERDGRSPVGRSLYESVTNDGGAIGDCGGESEPEFTGSQYIAEHDSLVEHELIHVGLGRRDRGGDSAAIEDGAMTIHRRNTSAFRPGWELLDRIADSLPFRQIERDIVVSALLYLQGELTDGLLPHRSIVELWWTEMDRKEAA